MAAYDLLGKEPGIPVWKLLGGKIHEEISLIGWIGAGTVEEGKQQAKAYVDSGFDTLKVKVGYGPENDEARIRAIREAVGDTIVLRVDANNAYSRDQALDSLKRLERYCIFHYEDPIDRDDVEGMAWLRLEVPVRLMAHACCITPADLIRVIRAEAADMVKLSVQINGGIHKTAQMMQIAAAAGMPATLGHSFSLTTNTLSEIHVGASVSNLLAPCKFVGLQKITDDVVREPLDSYASNVEQNHYNKFFLKVNFKYLWLDLSKRKVRVPDRPGLGLEIDPAKLAQYRTQ